MGAPLAIVFRPALQGMLMGSDRGSGHFSGYDSWPWVACRQEQIPLKVPVQAFVAESEDGSRQSVGAVEAKPLPAQAATVPVPQAAAQEAPVPSRPHVSIVEAKPLPARRTMPPAPAAPAAEVRARQSSFMAMLLVSPLLLMPSVQARPFCAHQLRLDCILCHCSLACASDLKSGFL